MVTSKAAASLRAPSPEWATMVMGVGTLFLVVRCVSGGDRQCTRAADAEGALVRAFQRVSTGFRYSVCGIFIRYRVGVPLKVCRRCTGLQALGGIALDD